MHLDALIFWLHLAEFVPPVFRRYYLQSVIPHIFLFQDGLAGISGGSHKFLFDTIIIFDPFLHH